jgi:Holliday junction resolvasome RuvABC endonuclease subunit
MQGGSERVVGIAHGLASAHSIPVVMLTPQNVRTRLGLHGHAKKAQIARAIRMQLSGIPAGVSNHALDAAAIALAGAREWHGQNIGKTSA